MGKWRRLQEIIFISFLILAIGGILIYYTWGEEVSLGDMRESLKELGVLAPIVFIVLYTIGTIFMPSTPFMAVAGILFGFKFGLLYTVIGGLLSSIIVFEISRRLGKNWVDGILQNKYMRKLDEYNKRLEKGAVWDLIILRTAPIMPFNVLNILMGVSRIKLADYMIGTVIGLAPSNVISVYLGNLLTKIF